MMALFGKHARYSTPSAFSTFATASLPSMGSLADRRTAEAGPPAFDRY
jgi:hypothetical protein